MKNKTQLIHEIGQEILSAKRLEGEDWTGLSLVVDLSEGAFSQSGFLYLKDKIKPFIAKSNDPLALRHLAKDLGEAVKVEAGQYPVQLLVQIRNEDKKLNIDFEYNNSNRWSIRPNNMAKMKEELRPIFS